MAVNKRYYWKHLEDRITDMGNGVCEVAMNRDFVCLIDECDVEAVRNVRWWVQQMRRRTNYAYGLAIPGKREVAMHRFILDMPEMIVDHINGNGLDNRRCNLRLVTFGQNMANRPLKHPDSAVQETKNGWASFYKRNGIAIRLGVFESRKMAELARCAFRKQIYGEHAPDVEIPAEVMKQVSVASSKYTETQIGAGLGSGNQPRSLAAEGSIPR